MNTGEKPIIRVSVETAEQYEAALTAKEPELIYLDAACFSPDTWKEFLSRTHQAGKKMGLRLQRIDEEVPHQEEVSQQQNLRNLSAAGLDAILIRAFEQIFWVKEIYGEEAEKNKPELVFDYTIYAYNTAAVQQMVDLGAQRMTYPIELNAKELKQLQAQLHCHGICIPYEMLVYGHLPMMVSANCIRKTTTGCNHADDILTLKDRMGKVLPVRCYCSSCYNQIFNADPLVLYDLEQEIQDLDVKSLRYDFTVESGKQTSAILAGTWQIKQMTRGHFKRGVE